jgi:hypothetical protein
MCTSISKIPMNFWREGKGVRNKDPRRKSTEKN